MRLYEAAMGLRLERLHYVRGIQRKDAVEPGRDVIQGNALGPSKNKLADDLLHPRSAGLLPCGDDDVVIAKRKSVPSRRIHIYGFYFPAFPGPLHCGANVCHRFLPGYCSKCMCDTSRSFSAQTYSKTSSSFGAS